MQYFHKTIVEYLLLHSQCYIFKVVELLLILFYWFVTGFHFGTEFLPQQLPVFQKFILWIYSAPSPKATRIISPMQKI